LLTWCDQDRIPYLTVWALSRENLRRDPVTLAPLAEAMVDGLQQMAVSRRWRIRVIGDLELLGSPLAADLRAIEAQTQDATGTVLNVAVAYSGRADIAHAAATLIHRHQVQDLDAIAVERLLCRYLSTAGQPDIDLVIRTSGEERLSGFMPWQAAQAELYFTPVLWPDFGLSEFRAALHSYAQRSRRCGL
jgi:short-chain Z-isoprenyl diphosphate synthase